MYIFSFEKLNVWKDSKEFVKEIYRVTTKFPDSEKFGMTSQLRRASISVPSNIAEGSSRKTSKDQAHFTTLAYSSLMEVLNQIIISHELNYIGLEDYQSIHPQIEMISNKLNALRNAQLNK
ncbi:four helix bundle protein [Wenyingzhuangia sp. chi5]|uniref:Four helix bundle protein n=1 Tax=Wenyingzhuangia gilva TaxID=3057677 RepID=A0ABT8VNL6_9FLAO|nr:four helix bundle protein [Wenyingzhuangia sp. chi5]MDO3693563.1 four helix bundle protein [Wenyingzhuangia sp. chi5]